MARDVAARTAGIGFDATATGDLYARGLFFNLARLRSGPWRLLNGSARPLRRGECFKTAANALPVISV